MKKFLALLLSLSMVLALSACGGTKSDDTTKADETKTDAPAETATDFKVGFIMLHDENSTYDLNFINAAKEACEKLGVEYKIITNVPEGQECYDKAAELADDGCNIIFADSFGHEDYMIQAAKEFPNVQFCHSTGTKAHTEGLSNYHNAFASIYEGRYLAGVAAGMKLNDMIANGYITEDQAKMGYVGAFTYAEVISGYTSFYLGAKSVCPSVTMDVTFTGSETRQRRRFLQVQFAVRLNLLRGSHDLLQDLVKAGVIGVQRQLLGHEANRGVVDAVDLFNGVLHLGSTVGAVDLELVMLLHNSFLLILIFMRTELEVKNYSKICSNP